MSPSPFPARGKYINHLQNPLRKIILKRMENTVKHAGIESTYWGMACFFSIMMAWYALGYVQKQKQHQRGNTMVSWKQLRFILKRRREASDLKLRKLPLVKDKETSHILITGTTGSGKTNTFHHLLPQIRARNDRAIIIDLTGDYVSQYYDPTTDVLLNPLDQRSHSWHPWADCLVESHYDVLANALIQPKGHSYSDPFWDNASRAVLKAGLRKFAQAGYQDVDDLYHFFMTATDQQFCQFFKGTEAATYASLHNDKTTSSIRSVLNSHIEGLAHLKTAENPSDAFSLRQWVDQTESKGWLFITAKADQRKTLIPLISMWIEILTNALMTLPPDHKLRLWFVIDELPALQRLPSLQYGLAEARKYGGCFLVGFQSKPQLEEIYGRNGAEAMLDLFNTKIFFRCTEPSTQVWISKVLGEREEKEPTENISYGAHSMRDGVSLSLHAHQTPLVLPTELALLRDLECYLKYPGKYPCAKMRMRYQASSLR